MEKFCLPTGKEKTRFKEIKEEVLLKTSSRRVGALYLVFSCNVLDIDKLSAQAACAASSLLETINLKSSNDSYHDLLKVVNEMRYTNI